MEAAEKENRHSSQYRQGPPHRPTRQSSHGNIQHRVGELGIDKVKSGLIHCPRIGLSPVAFTGKSAARQPQHP